MLALVVLCAHSMMLLSLHSFVRSSEEKKQEKSIAKEMLWNLGTAIALGSSALIIALDKNKRE